MQIGTLGRSLRANHAEGGKDGRGHLFIFCGQIGQPAASEIYRDVRQVSSNTNFLYRDVLCLSREISRFVDGAGEVPFDSLSAELVSVASRSTT